MMNDDHNNISYAFVILCMLILLVIQVHIIERMNELKKDNATLATALVSCYNTIGQLEKEVRLLQQDLYLIQQGEHAYDKD